MHALRDYVLKQVDNPQTVINQLESFGAISCIHGLLFRFCCLSIASFIFSHRNSLKSSLHFSKATMHQVIFMLFTSSNLNVSTHCFPLLQRLFFPYCTNKQVDKSCIMHHAFYKVISVVAHLARCLGLFKGYSAIISLFLLSFLVCVLLNFSWQTSLFLIECVISNMYIFTNVT